MKQIEFILTKRIIFISQQPFQPVKEVEQLWVWAVFRWETDWELLVLLVFVKILMLLRGMGTVLIWGPYIWLKILGVHLWYSISR